MTFIPTLLESDPLDIMLDTDGDLFIDGDGIHLISGLPGIAQLIRIAVGLFKGEWFMDLDAGVAYFETSPGEGDGILGEKFTIETLRDALSAVILKVPGVLSITTLVIDFDDETRTATATIETKTQFGDTTPDTLPVGGPTNA